MKLQSKTKMVSNVPCFSHIMANFYCSMMFINRSTLIIAFGGKIKINHFYWELVNYTRYPTHGYISGLRISFLLYITFHFYIIAGK